MAESKITAALIEAQQQFAPIHKDATNPHFRSKYASLDPILKAVTPALHANGMCTTQEVLWHAESQRWCLRVVLHHVSGETRESLLPLESEDGPQKMGSSMTYKRRQGITGLLSICPDEDDDGNAAQQTHHPSRSVVPPPTPKPAPPAEFTEEHFEKLKEKVEDAKTPDELGRLLDQAEKGERLKSNNRMMKRFIEACSSQILANEQAGIWQEAHLVLLDDRLNKAFKAVQRKLTEENNAAGRKNSIV